MKRSLVYLLFGRKQAVCEEVWDDGLELFPEYLVGINTKSTLKVSFILIN